MSSKIEDKSEENSAEAVAEVEASKEIINEEVDKDVPTDFDLDHLFKCFEECVGPEPDEVLNIKCYIEGYEELYKFLNILGTVFGWVSTDVDAKLNVLRNHRTSDHKDKYQDLKTMLSYEVEADLIKHKAKDSNTGARNLLRLHRALEYIIAFLEKVPKMEGADKCCPHSQSAYKATLCKFHPWIVQKAALLAMHMLPTKQVLIEKICAGDQEKMSKAEELLPVAVASMKKVYDKTEALYIEYGLLNLP